MEYDFIRDKDGSFSVELSMEHLVLGHWLNTELAADSDKIRNFIDNIKQFKNNSDHEKAYVGQEYTLLLTAEDAEVTANALHMKSDQFDDLLQEEDLHEDDELSRALCGLDDLQFLLEDWLDFIQG